MATEPASRPNGATSPSWISDLPRQPIEHERLWHQAVIDIAGPHLPGMIVDASRIQRMPFFKQQCKHPQGCTCCDRSHVAPVETEITNSESARRRQAWVSLLRNAIEVMLIQTAGPS